MKKAESTEPNEEENIDLEKDFEQTLINSSVYIISLSMQVSFLWLVFLLKSENGSPNFSIPKSSPGPIFRFYGSEVIPWYYVIMCYVIILGEYFGSELQRGTIYDLAKWQSSTYVCFIICWSFLCRTCLKYAARCFESIWDYYFSSRIQEMVQF